jgi:hypothetical protein
VYVIISVFVSFGYVSWLWKCNTTKTWTYPHTHHKIIMTLHEIISMHAMVAGSTNCTSRLMCKQYSVVSCHHCHEKLLFWRATWNMYILLSALDVMTRLWVCKAEYIVYTFTCNKKLIVLSNVAVNTILLWCWRLRTTNPVVKTYSINCFVCLFFNLWRWDTFCAKLTYFNYWYC